MRNVSKIRGGKAAAVAAAYLHALLLLVALALAPADPFFKSYENSATLSLIDASADETVDDIKIDGDDKSFWIFTQQIPVHLCGGESGRLVQDAPRTGGCSRFFHARAPPLLTI
jgi:hypothetical protein